RGIAGRCLRAGAGSLPEAGARAAGAGCPRGADGHRRTARERLALIGMVGARTRRPQGPARGSAGRGRKDPAAVAALVNPPLSARAAAQVVLAIVIVWATLFAPQLFRSRVFVLGDAVAFRPFAELSRARWTALHERTFWNPYVFCGIPAAPSLADSRP